MPKPKLTFCLNLPVEFEAQIDHVKTRGETFSGYVKRLLEADRPFEMAKGIPTKADIEREMLAEHERKFNRRYTNTLPIQGSIESIHENLLSQHKP